MSIVSIATLKSYFQTGDFPTESQFIDLIDTLAALPEVSSGTYTPTLTNISNITSSTARVCQYLKIGNNVTVSGSFNATITGAGQVTMYISLPVAAVFSVSAELGGTGALQIGFDVIGFSAGNDGSGTAIADGRWNATLTGAREYTFQFTYSL